jgi:transketolase
MLSERDLQRKSAQYRQDLLRLIKTTGAGHTGGDLSCLDILNVLYLRILRVSPETFKSPERDRYIQSKGHCAEALFVVLADRGFFPEKDLETPNRYGSHYLGHPTRDVSGVEQNTGALSHGLAVAVGLAFAAKMDRKDYRVFCLLGDGELAEGSNWEAAMTAAHYRLDNLVAIVDRSGLQITGSTEDVCQLSPWMKSLRRSASGCSAATATTSASWCARWKRCHSGPANPAWCWPRPAKAKA